jgi:MIP family channel proteins
MADMDMEPASWRKATAELIGTFTLIYVGILVLTVGGGAPLIAVAFAHGLAIAVMVSATMSISGGQLNPAVTLGLLSARKVTVAQAIYNIVAQIVGGLLGGYLAYASMGFAKAGGVPTITAGVPDLAPGVTPGTGILIEAILTFFLVFVIMGTAVDPRFGSRVGGLAIGLTIAMDIMAAGPLTGAAMNPARWIGAAVAAGHYGNGYVYIVGPIIGGILGALVYKEFLLEEPRPHPEPAAEMRAKGNR